MGTDQQRSLPESYRHLNEFAERFTAGSTLYGHGDVPERFFLVLSGTVHLQVPGIAGQSAPSGDAIRGQLVGHVPALAGRPAQTAASVSEDAVLIVVPISRLRDAFALSPDLATAIARDLGRRALDDIEAEIPEQIAPPTRAAVAEPESDPPAAEAPAETAAPAKPRIVGSAVPVVEAEPATGAGNDGWVQALTKLDGEYDESFFFVDTTDCPACGSRFEYLRVRTAGVRPQHRDTDFYVTYRSEDPTRYAIVVCPTCSYAALHDDFATLSEQERTAIVGARHARGRYDYPNLGGVRSLEDSLTALDLAQACYALREPSVRRDAVLLHRRAWIERERGDEAAEREWLEQARDAYRQSFELDSAISEESAMRVAYLIGDLSLRLGDPHTGAQWLETATRFPEAKSQSGLERQARDRLSDARRLVEELGGERKSA